MLWPGMEARRLHTLAEIGMLEKMSTMTKLRDLKAYSSGISKGSHVKRKKIPVHVH